MKRAFICKPIEVSDTVVGFVIVVRLSPTWCLLDEAPMVDVRVVVKNNGGLEMLQGEAGGEKHLAEMMLNLAHKPVNFARQCSYSFVPK